MFDWVRKSLNDPSPGDEEVADDAQPKENPSQSQAPKEAKQIIPGANQIQNQPTTYLEPLPWQLHQLEWSADEPHRAQTAPIHAATEPTETAPHLGARVVPDKPSHPFDPDLTQPKPTLAASVAAEPVTPSMVIPEAPAPIADASAMHEGVVTAIQAQETPDNPSAVGAISATSATNAADETNDADDAQAVGVVDASSPTDSHPLIPPSAPQVIPDMLTPSLSPLPAPAVSDASMPITGASTPEPSHAVPKDLSEQPTMRLQPPAALAPTTTSGHAQSPLVTDRSQPQTPAIVGAPPDLTGMGAEPLDGNVPQIVQYPRLSMRQISDTNSVAWRIPDRLAYAFANKDGESKNGNQLPGVRWGATLASDYILSASTGAQAPGAPLDVDTRIRSMVGALLSQPRLRASLPDEVIAKLILLLAPNPTQDQIARGMAALAALRTVMEVTHAEAIVSALPEQLGAWYHAANWFASRLWLARHLGELPANAQAQFADAAARLRAMGADAAAKTFERHQRLLDAARRVGVDAAYQEVIGDEAFAAPNADDSAAGDIVALKHIFDTVMTWIETPNWATSRDFLLAHPELLGDEAEAILARMYEVETEQRDQRDRQVIVDHQRLLRDARQLGVDAAYVARAQRANAIRGSVTPAQAQLAIPLMVWIETPDWNTSREYLRAHPSLLSDDGETLLARLYATQATDHGRQGVADHQRLLGDARERGIDVAYDAFREERRARRLRAAQAGDGSATVNGANGGNGAHSANGNLANGASAHQSGPTDTPLDATFRRYHVEDGDTGDEGHNGGLS